MPLSQYFRLVHVMASMALRADAKRFFLGYIWWILEPLLYIMVFYVVFSTLLNSRGPDFIFFLMTGKLPFIWFSKSVTQASSSIIAGKGLVGRVDIPKTLFPMAVVQEGMYRQAAIFLMMFVALWINGYALTSTWFYLIPLIIVCYLMIVACSFIGACLVCMMRDFVPLISLGMILLMFTSGIFWDLRSLGSPDKIDLVLTLNPLAFLLDGFRQVLMHGTAPDMVHLLSLGAFFGALIVTMVLVMRRGSKYLALKALTA